MKYCECDIKFYEGLKVKILTNCNKVSYGILVNANDDYIGLKAFPDSKVLTYIHKANIRKICLDE